MFAIKEDANLSTPVTVNVKVLTLEILFVIECCVYFPFQDLFVAFELISCVEMALGGDVQLSMVDRLKWNVGTPSVFSGMITSLVII